VESAQSRRQLVSVMHFDPLGDEGIAYALAESIAVRLAYPIAYRCVKFGGRFSMNAVIPSDWSSVANAEWKSRRS
jgi:hypothetical protein